LFGKKNLLIQLEFDNKYIYQITSDELDHTILIGRDRCCEWRIPATDRSASNRHAELSVRRGRVYIKDLNSHNGVYFLGGKITERAVAPGERYGIGDSILVISQCEEKKDPKSANRYHRLEQLNGKNRRKIFDLADPEYVIGSAHDADIRIEDSMVSQHHARLEIKNDGACWVTDLGSRNGTSVNRMSLSAENTEGRMLQHGDILSIVSVDFRFYDKDAPVQKSYFLLKTLCAAASVVILLSVYFFWQSLQPTAKAYIEQARRYAEVRQFDTALQLLNKSQDAPKAAVYKDEAADLRNQIENWKKTAEKWDEAKELIKQYRWISGNKIIVSLTAGKNDIWNWNSTDAVENRREAVLTANVLEPFLHARLLLAQPGVGIPALEADLWKLNKALNSIKGQKEDHFSLLHAEGKIVAEELAYVMNHLKTIEKMVSSINVDRGFDSEIASLQKIYSEALTRSRMPDKIERRLTPQLVVDRCKLYLPPLKALSVAQKQFIGNQQMLAALEFKQLKRELTMPTAEECAVSPVFTTVRNALSDRNQLLLQCGKQLEVFVNVLKNHGIETSRQPAILANWQKNGFLENLLKCDCFQYSAKQWTPRRKTPIGVYDRFLGIELFWDFLRDLPEKYDASLQDDRPFVPEIVRIRKIYSDLDDFRKCLEDPIVTLLVSLEIKNPRLQNLALWVDDLLSKRDDTLNRFVQFSRKTGNRREALIAGGAALILDNGKNRLFTGEYNRLAELLKTLRRETGAIANQDAAPEIIIRNRRKIVAIGLPGDSVVRRAFNEISEEKK
ncbi:MAG: FHA domain-containing protein, partial [Lentisphaeria bacterium]|nr:FHA domain-containing protein [Lentisphaeria bacterium]